TRYGERPAAFFSNTGATSSPPSSVSPKALASIFIAYSPGIWNGTAVSIDHCAGNHDARYLRPPLRLWHPDARLCASDGAAAVGQRGVPRRGDLPWPALHGEALSGPRALRRGR